MYVSIFEPNHDLNAADILIAPNIPKGKKHCTAQGINLSLIQFKELSVKV
jgi:hypothetical protein